jgi:hypothetical protein
MADYFTWPQGGAGRGEKQQTIDRRDPGARRVPMKSMRCVGSA